jgi:hypothetical protein
MKAILLIDIPDDICDYHQNWSVTSNDEIELRYEEDGSLKHFMNLGMNLELKPMPEKQELRYGGFDDYLKTGWNDCIDWIYWISGENNE